MGILKAKTKNGKIKIEHENMDVYDMISIVGLIIAEVEKQVKVPSDEILAEVRNIIKKQKEENAK